jgi:hypothetical protein
LSGAVTLSQEKEHMQVLVCRNNGAYISALTPEMLWELSLQHSVVVNEHEHVDAADNFSQWHQCYIANFRGDHLQQLKQLFPDAKVLPPETYAWQQGQEALVIGKSAWDIKRVLLEQKITVVDYRGPSGH